jgi:hypothetical protein
MQIEHSVSWHLLGRFCPKPSGQFSKKLQSCLWQGRRKTLGFSSCPSGQTVPFSGTSSRKGMGNCNPYRVCRRVKTSFRVIGSHGETCSLLLPILLSQQNTKNHPGNDLSEVAARIFFACKL